LKKAVEMGFAYSYWCGSAECEAKIKEETRATMRCIPMDQSLGDGDARAGGTGACVYCGNAAAERAIFARAY
jgi:prolyl-tRNA synthetase